jgi:hypothetical protein
MNSPKSSNMIHKPHVIRMIFKKMAPTKLQVPLNLKSTSKIKVSAPSHLNSFHKNLHVFFHFRNTSDPKIFNQYIDHIGGEESR